MDLKIVSTDKIQEYHRVKKIILPGFKGHTTILSGHAEAFLLLREGKVIAKTEDKKIHIVNIDSPAQFYIKKGRAIIIL